MRKIKIQSILAAVAGLFLATSCSSSFLDTDPTDAVSSDKVSVPENAEALVNGAWYNLFDYSSTYANIGYRALQCLDDMMESVRFFNRIYELFCKKRVEAEFQLLEVVLKAGTSV